jgi:hypothetical protein
MEAEMLHIAFESMEDFATHQNQGLMRLASWEMIEYREDSGMLRHTRFQHLGPALRAMQQNVQLQGIEKKKPFGIMIAKNERQVHDARLQFPRSPSVMPKEKCKRNLLSLGVYGKKMQ